VILRVPSVSTRIFLRVIDMDTYQQSASMCIYRATQDGSWGLTFMIYFNHGYSQKSIISSIGSNILCLILAIRSKLCMIISSGARSALPMVVAPKAIVEYFQV
jgi:hypothetical protein